MRRRPGFTLVEMLVSVALVLFIMVILTEAFGKGLESFRTLKAIGDMEARLRTAAAILRRDLTADHFEGKRRLSDPTTRWTAMGVPREGFFRHEFRTGVPADVLEGQDSDGIPSGRSARSVLHFSVKLRGNDRSQFFTAKVPLGSPLLTVRTNFFGQPDDARFQDTALTYSSQWAEVAYWLEPNGTSNGAGPLYTLFRTQLVVVADNSLLNWPTPVVLRKDPTDYDEFSCLPIPNTKGLYVNNPTDLNDQAKRAFKPLTPTMRGATPVLPDVVSFAVAGLGRVDTHHWGDGINRITASVPSLSITIRVWDQKTRQTRQITIVQDM